MTVLDGIRTVLGDTAITNVLLGLCAVQLRMFGPHLMALTKHFKLRVPRAATEQPHE